jgi:YD repeat-containing protein
MSATTFDAIYALPLTQSAFGKLQHTFGYDTTSTVASGQRGTLKTVKDGNNHTTTYTNWKRGIPQAVAFADSTSRTALVNDVGWITSTTDENGDTTGYGYDAMGRLASIVYPTGDTTAWAGTSRSFVPVATTEYGIPAGHWRLTEHTGNGYKITYYDAQWRPMLVREYDYGNVAGTQRFVKMAYDANGRTTFTSYPSASSAPVTGTWTDYDALGRPVSVAQDTELSQSLQVTTSSYETGFKTTVTDPLGHATTMYYMAYDQPGTDWPVGIDAPEDQTTTFVRDPFGKPLSITRGETPR